VTVKDPLTHLYDVEMQIDGVQSATVEVAMPAWSPGVFTIMDFARNVQEFEAATRQNRSLPAEQVDKQTWRISKNVGEDIRVRYRVYSSTITDEFADLNPASVFMYVVGYKRTPITIRLETRGGWKTYAGLDKRGDRYTAPGYDVLAASPMFLGTFKVLEFKSSGGVNFEIVFSNPKIQMIDAQVEADLTDIADTATLMFGSLPFRRYTYLVRVQPFPGASSVGFLQSTRIAVGENDFVNQSGYTSFLIAAAQGLTKAWYGGLIRPRSMMPYDFSKEAYRRILWFTEGVSAYSADMLLLRSGILTSPEYFVRLSGEIDALQRLPGRRVTSIEEASWNAWTRSDNSASVSLPYVLKGKIAGLLLDSEIRGSSAGRKTLESVVSYLAQDPGSLEAGLGDDQLEAAIKAATDVDASEFFNSVIRGTEEINYNHYLQKIGIQSSSRQGPATLSFGIEFEQADGNLARIRRVLPNSPAERARLDGGDVILALDSERITFDSLTNRIHSKQLGKPVEVTILRGERMLTLDLVPGTSETETWNVGESLSTSPEQSALYQAWSRSLLQGSGPR